MILWTNADDLDLKCRHGKPGACQAGSLGGAPFQRGTTRLVLTLRRSSAPSAKLTAAPAAYSRIAYSSGPAAGGEDVRDNDFGLWPIRALQHQKVLKMPRPEAALGTDQIRRLISGIAKVVMGAMAILAGLWLGFALGYALW